MKFQFHTEDLELFQAMIDSAIEKGLCFESYDRKGTYYIHYTGGR